MALRIQTNTSAMTAQRTLGINQDLLSKSIEKLTSGFRINRAADDAAGLGIANKFRADGRALGQASRNAEQATSVLSIAEGAVSSVATILDRMKELATQSASDTVTSSGRTLIDQEFTQLRQEITRVVSTTKFQGAALLDNSFGIGAVTTGAMFAAGQPIRTANTTSGTQGLFTISNGSAGVLQIVNGSATQTVAAATSGAQTINFSTFGISLALTSTYTGSATQAIGASGVLTLTQGTSGGSFMIGSSGAYTTSDMLQLFSMDLRTSSTGLDLDGSQLDTLANSQSALTKLDNAIAGMNLSLGNIGSSMNRIDYAMQNLKIRINNTAASESVIRDLDIGDEMTKYSKTQVLVQAGTAMLAQANATSQSALQLLK